MQNFLYKFAFALFVFIKLMMQIYKTVKLGVRISKTFDTSKRFAILESNLASKLYAKLLTS